jgi:hypothetical protein
MPAAHIATTTATDLYVEAGFAPADEFEHMNSKTGEWFARSWDALTWTADGEVLCAVERDDTITLALLTSNGLTKAELRFDAPDGEVYDATAAAFLAVAEAWS